MRMLAILFVLMCASLACAQAAKSLYDYTLYPQMEDWDPADYTLPNHLLIYPDGRTSLADASMGNCQFVVTYLRRWQGGQWVVDDFPHTGLVLDLEGGNIQLCDSHPLGIPLFQVPGPMYFLASQPIRGGGHSQVDASGAPVSNAYVWWSPDDMTPVEIYFNSPDIDGDLDVDIDDQTIFISDLYGSYSFRSDFNFDGVINLSDLSKFTSALGSGCQ